MADERSRTRTEVKRLFTGLKQKGITDEMMSILIDFLYRDPVNFRNSGFEFAGSYDSQISFDVNNLLFSIKPFDPLADGFQPRYGIFSLSTSSAFQRFYDELTIEIPDEEGLFCIYFDKEPDPGRNQILTFIKNPTTDQLQIIYTTKVVVSFIYWDEENQQVLHFGDDRHGSEWNSQIHWYLHKAFAARRETGLQIIDYIINGDGSNNNHTQFRISAGIILHDDFELEIPESTTTIPVLYLLNNVPRFASNFGYSFLKGSNRLYFNAGLSELTEADNDNFVIYHYFATNEIENSSRKIISVMGIEQYTSLQAAYTANRAELNEIENSLPMQGRCYIDSAIFQYSDNYTNDLKSRLVGFVSSLLPEAIEPVTEMLQGDIDGINTLFTTSRPYAAGKISVLLNGLKEYQFSEINETKVQLVTPPKKTGFTDILECIYKLK